MSLPSFENVREKWVFEVSYYYPSILYIIVGTKTDLRDKLVMHKIKPIEKDRGQRLAKELRVKYLECNVFNYTKLKGVFDKVY